MMVVAVVVAMPLPLPWVTLTQHHDDSDSPSIVAAVTAVVAAATAFVQHRGTSEKRSHTHGKSCRERQREMVRDGRERERGKRGRRGRKEKDTVDPRFSHRRRDASASARVYQRRELDVRANSRDTSLAAVTPHTCRIHLALSRSINPDPSGPSRRGNLIPWGGGQRRCSVPVPVPAPRSFSPFTRTRVCPYVRAMWRRRHQGSRALSPLGHFSHVLHVHPFVRRVDDTRTRDGAHTRAR